MFVQSLRFVYVKLQAEILPETHSAPFILEIVPRKKLINMFEQSFLGRNVFETEVFSQMLFVELLFETGMGQKALDFGAKKKRIAVIIIIKRLDAENVAGSEQF